jgi:NAD(P)-dependent dehydrogenase (short-subunit alcohol dehydrogenase family)
MNCAGEGGSPGGIASVDLDRLQRMLAIHLGGAVAGMKYAAPVMAAQRSGSIIFDCTGRCQGCPPDSPNG